jgi:hypothetical protein
MRTKYTWVNAPGRLIDINEVRDRSSVGYRVGGRNKAHGRDDYLVAWPHTDSKERQMQGSGSIDDGYSVRRSDELTDRFFERGDKGAHRGNKTTIDALGEVLLFISRKNGLVKAAGLWSGDLPNPTNKVAEIIHEP